MAAAIEVELGDAEVPAKFVQVVDVSSDAIAVRGIGRVGFAGPAGAEYEPLEARQVDVCVEGSGVQAGPPASMTTGAPLPWVT